MRTLLIGTLATTLVGCSCMLPPQVRMDACTAPNGAACFDRAAANQPTDAEPASFKANSATIGVKSASAARTQKPPPARFRKKNHPSTKKPKPPTIAAEVEPPASGQPAETSEPV